MSEPKVADTKPVILDLEPGTYSWCTCGLSGKQPFCDGAHRGGEFRSLKFQIGEEGQKQAALCLCKQTSTPPYCDGSHQKLR